MPNYGRRSVRLQEFHYGATAAYFITICTAERSPLFGRVHDGLFTSNALGRIVAEEWQTTGDLRRVGLDAFVVMPNHVHGIVVFEENGDEPGDPRAASRQPPRRRPIAPGTLVPASPRDTGAASQPPRRHTVAPGTLVPASHQDTRTASLQPRRRHTIPLGNLVSGFKASVTKRARRELGWNAPLWQRNYYEHVIRAEDDLATIRDYIVNNPAKWTDDRYHV